jgi:phage-related holin
MKDLFAGAWKEVLGFLALFFMDIYPALIAVGVLIFADTITGIWKAIRSKQKVESRRMGRIITKLLLYPLCIIVAKAAEDHLAPQIPFVKVTTGIVAVVEIKSIYENASVILGFDLWKKVKDVIWNGKKKDA